MLEIINGFVSSAVSTATLCVFGYIIFKGNKIKKNNLWHNIIIIIISIILHTIIFMTLDGIIKTICICVLFMLTFKFIFNLTHGKALILSILYTIILLIPDLIVTLLFSYILGKIYFYSSLAGGIVTGLIVGIIMVLITLLLRKPLKKLVDYKFSTNKKIILVSFLVLISLGIFFYSLINTFEFSNNIIGYLIVIVTLIIILFYLFKQKLENEAVSKKYDELLDIMKNYESDIEEQRIAIHETRNELMTIKCKISDNEKETEIIDYIDSILGDKVSSKMSKYSKFKYLPSNGIKGFFYYKFTEAEKRNIKVSVNISKKIENSFLGKLDTKDFKDLVRIIGVYLDNAIEASVQSKDKKLGIEIYLIKKDIDIIISNTFNNELNIEKLGIERFTTKGKNRGHGLLLVKHILNNNNIFESENNIINDIYTQKLKIKNSK